MNRVLFRYELLGLLRDTRTIVLSVLLPIVLLPLLLLAMQRAGSRGLGTGAEPFAYGRATGSSGLQPLLEAAFERAGFLEMSAELQDQELSAGSVQVFFRSGRPEKADPELARSIARAYPILRPLAAGDGAGRPVVELLYRSDRERSTRAYVAAVDRLIEYREALLEGFFAKQKARVGWKMETHDASSAQEREARRYGPALSAFMVLVLLGGGSVAALDSLAGERERGTLTTLFSSSLSRPIIIWTKFCAVSVISVVIALIQMANLGLYAWLGLMKLPASMGLGQSSLILAALTALFLAVALFTASLLLHISARSGSFKEAQLFFFPAFLISFALSLSGLMPGLGQRSAVSLVPLAGPGVMVPEVLAGRVDLPILLLQVAVHSLLAWLILRRTLAYVSREEFLGGQPPAVGAELRFEQFSGRVLPFFGLLGAALMVIPANFASLSTLQGQGVFNQMVLFGLGPLLLLWLYRQPLSKAVPLRSVSLPIVLAALALVPLGQAAATGLSYLLGPLLPPPVKAMEQMLDFLDLENTPAWQIYLLIGVLPGVFEEFAFRGVMLYALHRRIRSPWMLSAVVALVFGFFHLSFYRVAPTAYLGFFLGLLTLGTGSLLPAMLVHVGNNSFAVTAMLQGWDFEGLPGWVYVLCFAAQLLMTGLILRWGRGYPGTRWERAPQARGEQVLDRTLAGSGADSQPGLPRNER